VSQETVTFTVRERLADTLSSGRGCSGAACKFCLHKADVILEELIDIVEAQPAHAGDTQTGPAFTAVKFKDDLLTALKEGTPE
jgi:hypothetical protein